MTRKCGDCRHTEKAGENVIWCYGAPPTVISRTQEGNTVTVNSSNPMLSVDARACAVFAPKAKSRK